MRTWSHDGDTWQLKGFEMDADGAKTTNTIVIMDISENAMKSQTIDAKKDGEEVPDGRVFEWKRKK